LPARTGALHIAPALAFEASLPHDPGDAMGWFMNMSTTAKIVLGVIAFTLLATGVFVAYTRWDAHAHYVPAKARVTWVSDDCTLERSAGRHRRRREIGPMDCEAARLKQGQGYSSYSLRRHRHVGYSFVSPVDHRPHDGRIDASRADYPDVHAGSEIDILAHKTEAGKSRRPI
jgi:hypothetical protein